jgi:hypothetical protein
MEKFTPSQQPPKPKEPHEELTLETPEQEAERLGSVSSEVASETQSQNIDVAQDKVKPLTASEELLELKRERFADYHRSEFHQKIAEATNIAYNLAKERGIDIDMSKLEDMGVIHDGNAILIPTLNGTVLMFPFGSDKVFEAYIQFKPGGFAIPNGGKDRWELSPAEATNAREKYKPEKLMQLYEDAEAIYKKRNELKK